MQSFQGHSRALVFGLGLAAAAMAGSAAAAESASPTFFLGQRFWSSSLDLKLLDAAVVVNPNTQQPMVRTALASRETSTLLSITSLGARLGDVTVLAAVMPSARMSSDGFAAGSTVRRSEFDLSVGYALLPSLTASLIYKSAKLSPSMTQAASQLLGGSGEQHGRGMLLGLSGSAGMDERLSLYGNAAYGPVRWKVSGEGNGANSNAARYTVAEVGLAYRLVGPGSIAHVSGVNLQLGYRVQTVQTRGVETGTYSLSGQAISLDRYTITSSSQGFVLGLGATF